MGCTKLGGKGIVGRGAKVGVRDGIQSGYNIHVPKTEPLYSVYGIPSQAQRNESRIPKQRGDLLVSGHGGVTKIVDVTAAGAFPPALHIRDARKRGFLAKRAEERKRMETIDWKSKPKVEFVPFAIDLYGAAAPMALKFISWMKQQAEPEEGNELEKRVFDKIHPSRFWERISINVIKACSMTCNTKSYGVPVGEIKTGHKN